MVDLIIHHKHQEDQYHIIPHWWRAWCCREVDTTGWRGDLVLGEATRWCTAAGVLWSTNPTASRPLLKSSSFGSHCRQWTVARNPLPTSGSGKDAPPPLNLLVLPFGSSWWQRCVGLCIDNILPYIIPLLGFWFSVKVYISFGSLYHGH